MFVSGIKFLLTVSRDLNFVTAQFVPNREYSTYAGALQETCKMYARCNFFMSTIFADPEFKTFENYLTRK